VTRFAGSATTVGAAARVCLAYLELFFAVGNLVTVGLA